MITSKNTDRIILSAVVLVACFLFIFNLDNQYLWQDEAQTALISKTILTDNIPLGYDGKNYFSQDLGIEYGNNYMWKWHPWFPFYLLALFFKIFGVSTFVARLPFALLGIGSVLLIYYFAKLLWEDRRIAIVAAILMLLSVPFIILAKQCRYYSPSIFLSIAALYAYLLIINSKKYGYAFFIITMMLLFHTQYIYCFTITGTILIHSLTFHKNRIKIVLLLSLIVILTNLPWLVWVYNVDYTEVYPHIFNPAKFIQFIKMYFADILQHVFPPLLMLIPLCTVFFKWIKKMPLIAREPLLWKNLFLISVFIILTIVALSLFSYAAFFRNIAPLIPAFLLIAALLIVSLMNIHVIAGAAVIVLLIVFSPIDQYIYEITHDYDGPIEGIVKHLNANARQKDIVAITYGDMPLKFYTDLRVVGGLTGEDLSNAKNARWVIIRKYIIGKKSLDVRNIIVKNTGKNKYQKIAIQYPDIPYENRESPGEHRFRTETKEDRVILYRKLE
jgi:4-amino-4-deoxy-L-arabinose transferase-like glycosyltransferase